MGLLEPITHKEEIDQILNDARQKYDGATKKFESQKKATTVKLENLGKVKIKAWSKGMDAFVDAFGSFKNVEIENRNDTNMSFIGSGDEPNQMIINIQNASWTAGEVAKAGFAAVGTGALVGIASYGGVMMFGSASTGTAIATLSGAARTNATMAWFGGGSLKSGGLGVANGKLVLAGIVVAPILIVGSIIAGAKGKERLAEAKKINAEAEDAASKLDIITTGMSGVADMSDNYSNFINKFSKKFAPFVEELRRIKEVHSNGIGEKVDFNDLSIAEQKIVHLSWLMAQINYHILSTPILTDNGEVTSESSTTLKAANKEFKQIKKSAFKMTGDDAPAANLIWASPAKRMIIINFAIMAIFIFCGCMFMTHSVMRGITYFVSSLIVFPIFFKFKNLPASKLFAWRIVKLVAALLFALLIEVLLRGVM